MVNLAEREALWEDGVRRGRLESLLQLQAEATSSEIGWALCVRLRRAMFLKHWTTFPSQVELEAVLADSARHRRSLAWAAALGARAAILRLDPHALAGWVTLHERLGDDAWARLGRAWLEAFRGNLGSLSALAKSLEKAGREIGDGLVVVESATIGAFAALEAGEPEDALARARRASRMAASEGLGPFTVLAHVVLARARRKTGHAYLGAHVATTLGSLLAHDMRSWVEWETVLGAGSTAPPAITSPARDLAAGVAAMEARDRAMFEAAWSSVCEHPAHFVAEDARALQEVSDWRATPAAEQPWIDGHAALTARRVHGVCGASETDAVVLGWPAARGRRVLAIGAKLAAHETDATLVATERDQARTDSAIAALLLVGPEGIERASLFASLYGFPYVHRHDGVLRVLLHRVRKRVEPWGALSADGSRVALETRSRVLFPDPRCHRGDQAMLVLAVSRGSLEARDVSLGLGIPLRRAQESLQRLAEAGLMRAQKSGRVVHYILEDTTFTEPTPP